MQQPSADLTPKIEAFWDAEACGTRDKITQGAPQYSKEWFERVRAYRDKMEPELPSVVRFDDYRGKRLLEVGVGAGSDHVRWARAGAHCWGVDLTNQAVEVTRRHLDLEGLTSRLQKANAESLPFPDASFDVVYSWGVIHHAAHPERIVAEIRRVLKPGGHFVGMVYHRRSMWGFMMWVRWGLLRGRPWKSIRRIAAEHLESPGTQVYSVREARELFSGFSDAKVWTYRTTYDLYLIPKFLGFLVPHGFGWYIAVRATR